MSERVDVLILGGGIIGLSCAVELADAGLRVEIVERGAFGREASWAGAGIVPPGNFDGAATPIDKLRAYGAARFPAFSKRLRDETGIDNEFTVCGGIEYLTPDEAAEYPGLWRAEGLTFERLDDGCRGVVTTVGLSAWHLPGFAQVRNPRHLRALIAACERRGVRMTQGTAVEGWQFRDGVVTGATLADGGLRTARQFVVAAGAWANDLLAPLNQSQRVHPVRGQIVLFHGRPGLLPHVLLCGKRYVVPRRDGRVLVGSTEEPEAGFTKANTPAGIAALTAFARDLVPGLRESEVEAAWSGLRPGSAGGVPTIARVPGHSNVIAAVGHFRAGIQLSVGTAALVRALVTGADSPIDPAGFAFDRSPDSTARPTFRS